MIDIVDGFGEQHTSHTDIRRTILQQNPRRFGDFSAWAQSGFPEITRCRRHTASSNGASPVGGTSATATGFHHMLLGLAGIDVTLNRKEIVIRHAVRRCQIGDDASIRIHVRLFRGTNRTLPNGYRRVQAWVAAAIDDHPVGATLLRIEYTPFAMHRPALIAKLRVTEGSRTNLHDFGGPIYCKADRTDSGPGICSGSGEQPRDGRRKQADFSFSHFILH